MNQDKRAPLSAKREWRAPEVARFAAGSAESQRGANPDGGGGNQGS
jgi:hypothetical protein